MILLSREDCLHPKEQTRPQDGPEVLRIGNLIAEDIDSTLKLAMGGNRREDKGRTLQNDVLVGLLPDHPAEFVLVGKYYGQRSGLGTLDESSSAARKLDVVGVREVE